MLEKLYSYIILTSGVSCRTSLAPGALWHAKGRRYRIVLTKTAMLEQELIQAIHQGKYAVGQQIPSRNQLIERYHCSRTIVERAIATLTRTGYLGSRKGSGTYVVNRVPKRIVKTVRVVAEYDVRNTELSFFSCFMMDSKLLGKTVKWIPTERVRAALEELASPDGAVIWMTPGYEMLETLNFLRLRNIPQLLINRNFEGFDNVRTDQFGSICEGLTWLLAAAGRDMALVGRVPTLSRPYQYERLIACYQAMIAKGMHLAAERCFIETFTDIPKGISEIGARLFGEKKIPGGIFVLNIDLVLPLVMYAQGCGLTVGQDYKLLIFDDVSALKDYPGIGMMHQAYPMFQSESLRWLESGAALSAERFESLVKTEFILHS